VFGGLFFCWLASRVGSLIEVFESALWGEGCVFLGSRIRILVGFGAEVCFEESSLLGWFWGIFGGRLCELARW
jgi:hypothetical protein